MSFNKTVKLVEDSEIFKDFIRNHENAELCVGFFVLDFIKSINQMSVDYKIGKKVFTFSVNDLGEVSLKEDELIENPKFPPLTKIKSKVKIDLEEAESIARGKAFDESVAQKFEKIIAIVQNYEDNQVWNLTCMLASFVILNIIIDADDAKIVKFDKKTMGDFIRKA